jgi:limonene 1,2-monooxygenase
MRPLRFGVFFAPFHPPGQDPTLAMEYDLDRTVLLDKLGYDEVWFGEHHSAGYELLACPEIMIAVAAERTKRIMLGTGVTSLPYHHPFMVADRMVMVDHLTRGRVIMGCGPGALPTDAYMMGIEPKDQRRRMEESLEAILALLQGEIVSRETDWFVLRDARLQILPYTRPRFEIAAAAMISPSGPRAAGKFGVSLLSLGGVVVDPTVLESPAALDGAWNIVEENAEATGHTADRQTWRVLSPVHLADTVDQALRDVDHGLEDFANYFGGGGGFVLNPGAADAKSLAESYRDSGSAVIGTPDDLIAHIDRLQEESGGFGTFLVLGHDWADRAATYRSYELIAKYVIPHYKGRLAAPHDSHEWAKKMRDEIFAGAFGALGTEVAAFKEAHADA